MTKPDSNLILGDPELLVIIGEINLEWDEIEMLLWNLFDALLNVPWNVSHAVFFSQQNHRARRDMLASLAKATLGQSPNQLKMIENLLGRIKRAAKKRNDIFHGLWVLDQEEPIRRIPIHKTASERPGDAYRKPELKRAKEQLARLRVDLDEFVHPLWMAKRKKYQKERLT